MLDGGWIVVKERSHPTKAGMQEINAITVVIPARNAAKTILAQLESLERQRGDLSFSVIVVDNGSTDGTRDVVESYKSAKYRLRVVEEKRAGVNFARNRGIESASDGLILLCDADDEVSDCWLQELVSASRPGCWVAGVVDYVALNTAKTRRYWAVGESSALDKSANGTFGGNCAFHRSMWQSVGRFDEMLSGAGDETEFFARARSAGFQQLWADEAIVHYRLRPGLRNICRQQFRRGLSQAQVQLTAATGESTQGRYAIVLSLLKLLIAAPKYFTSTTRRYEWIGSASRQLGHLAAQRR